MQHPLNRAFDQIVHWRSVRRLNSESGQENPEPRPLNGERERERRAANGERER